MDEEQLDNGLINHIRDVFDNFEDPGADEGWLKLREKYPEEKKDRGAIWLWWGSAAAVLVLCFGVWFFYQPAQPINFVVNPKKSDPAAIIKASADTSAIKNNPEQNIAATSSPVVRDSARDAKNSQFGGSTPTQTENRTSGKNQSENYTASSTLPSVPKNQPVPVSVYVPSLAIVKPAVTAKTGIDSGVSKTAIAQNPVKVVKPGSNTIASVQVDSNAIAVVKTQPDDVKPISRPAILAMMNDQKVKLATDQKKDKKQADKTLKKAMFSVYAATYVNYAPGSDSQVNMGAGFTSDFSLSSNLKFSTGLAISQNTLNYNNGTPQSYSGGGNKAFADVSSTYASSSPTALSNLNRTLLVSQNYNANLVGLDIPLNLKFEFNPKKSDTFISAGFSSGTFINERYHSTLNYSNLSNNTAQSQEQTTSKSFSSFDFAKTLNISFGVGAQVGKSNRLIIEPFLKYPLDGLGAEQIRFGAGGINLKLNFQTKK